MRLLNKFTALPFKRKLLLAESLAFVATARAGLWLTSFRRLESWLSRFQGTVEAHTDTDWNEVRDVTESVRIASRLVPKASCLTQALAAKTMLGRRRQSSTLHFGVDRRSREDLSAHAWVEVEGKIVIGEMPGHVGRYAVLRSESEVAK